MHVHQIDKVKRQKANHYKNHHPKEKSAQLIRIKHLIQDKNVLEIFGGEKNITPLYYHLANNITTLTIDDTGDSFEYVKNLANKTGRGSKKYDVIDIDGYGFSEEMFPHVFKLIVKYGTLIYTAPRQCSQIPETSRNMYERMFDTRKYPRMDEIMDGLNKYANIYNLELTRTDCFEVSNGRNQGGITRQVFRVRTIKNTRRTYV